MVRLVAFVLVVMACGCQASQQAVSPQVSADTPASSDPAGRPTSTGGPVSSPTPPATAATAPTAGPTTNAAPTTVATTNAPTARVHDACDLLPASAVVAAIGAEGARAASSSQAQFTSCAYTLTASGGTGTVALDLATSRAGQIYSAALAGGGYSPVTGVGSAAAYNDAGHFIAHDADAFVSITLPVNLGGTKLGTPATARTAAASLAKRALSAAG